MATDVSTFPAPANTVDIDEYTEVSAAKEVCDLVATVWAVKRELAPDKCLKDTRVAMNWLIRQSLRWSIQKWQRRVDEASVGVPERDSQPILVAYKSLETLMGLWTELEGTEEELQDG